MTRKLAILSALAAGCLALAFTVAAEAQEARKYGEVDVTTVVSVEPEAMKITVRNDQGDETVFHVDGKTQITSGGDSIALSDISKDAQVAIGARSGLQGDETVAEYIQLVVADTDQPGEPAGSAPLEPVSGAPAE